VPTDRQNHKWPSQRRASRAGGFTLCHKKVPEISFSLRSRFAPRAVPRCRPARAAHAARAAFGDFSCPRILFCRCATWPKSWESRRRQFAIGEKEKCFWNRSHSRRAAAPGGRGANWSNGWPKQKGARRVAENKRGRKNSAFDPRGRHSSWLLRETCPPAGRARRLAAAHPARPSCALESPRA
jgi:hypothetical protein